jgi:hypothetical protein
MIERSRIPTINNFFTEEKSLNKSRKKESEHYFRLGAIGFPLLHIIHNGSCVPPFSYVMSTAVSLA